MRTAGGIGAILILTWIIIQLDRIDKKMRIAKSVRLVYCRFIAKPFIFLEVFAGTGRSKQGKWTIIRTVGGIDSELTH
jgi:hypothetical protein